MSGLIRLLSPASVRHWFHAWGVFMINRLSLALIAACLLGTGATAQTDDDDKARIQLLEDQVVQLQEEIRKLGDIIAAMQTRLNQVGNDIHALQNGETAVTTAAIQECVARRDDMIKKRDHLKAMGLKDGHPDIVNISGIINQINKECGPAE